VAKPKTVGGIFKTIFNEFKGIGRSLVSARTPKAKIGVVASFAKRTIGNLVKIGVKVVQNTISPKKTNKTTRRQQIQAKETERIRATRKGKTSVTDRQTTNTQVNDKVSTDTPPVKPANTVIPVPKFPSKSAPAKVYYMTDSMRTAIANTQVQYEKQKIAEAERKARILNSRSPQPYRQGNEGEQIHTLKCVNVGCSENGTFQIADGNLVDLRQKFGNDPANCYSCKLLKYNSQQTESVTGQCETCGNTVSLKSEDWIGYHKYKGKPTFDIFCNTCRQNRKLEEQAAHNRQLAISYRGDREGIRKFGMEHEDDCVRAESKILSLKIQSAKCVPIPNLVNISDLSTFPNENLYHSRKIGNGNMDSIYKHINHHVIGGNDKCATLSDFGSTYDVIVYSYQIAQLGDKNFVIDSNGNDDETIIKVDLQKGIKFVFYRSDEGWFLKTAFRDSTYDSITGNQKAYSDRESAVRLVNKVLGSNKSRATKPKIKTDSQSQNQFAGKTLDWFAGYSLVENVEHLEKHVPYGDTGIASTILPGLNPDSLLREALIERLASHGIVKTGKSVHHITKKPFASIVVKVDMGRTVGYTNGKSNKPVSSLLIVMDENQQVHSYYPVKS
jgi:hypothetical protein